LPRLWGKFPAASGPPGRGGGEIRVKKRPASVTVIAWLLIVFGGILFITNYGNLPKITGVMSHSPLNIFRIIFSYVIISFAMISGIGILKRQNWARLFYLIAWLTNSAIFMIYSQPINAGTIYAIILFLITIYFLFNQKANNYFAGRDFDHAAG
jgi:hypothetical protein